MMYFCESDLVFENSKNRKSLKTIFCRQELSYRDELSEAILKEGIEAVKLTELKVSCEKSEDVRN